MLDHIFLTVTDISRSVVLYESVLPLLGVTARHDHDGAHVPMGHPDLKGFGAKGRLFSGCDKARLLLVPCTSAWSRIPKRW
ncbi:VOC family protein [Delftia acidovorans]|uniref:Uncharacterized protein n=1 Tax=Delftia acidovorans TaxID=80866 RepID=A0AAJ2V947_DELAC|nr:hypothetical protein [Delftia acidovorans]MDX4956549.1 hypothetical protein [Delftia acidovorans]